jgi:signal transduction histidine kinase
MTRILIVEDSPTQAEYLRLILEDQGFVVDHATDGRLGVESFLRGDYSMVISDIMMPEMTGYELCKEIKKTQKGQNTPVILLSTLNDPMDIIRGLECGADNFLTKPYEAEQLTARVANVLQNREARAAKRITFGVEVVFLGQTFVISSEKEQILDLLIATFEDIVRTNRGLLQSKAELSIAKQEIESYALELERRVEERTAELLEQQKQLHQSQKMETIGHLTGGIAHDFNNLLTIVIGNLDLLATSVPDDTHAHAFARDALTASLRGADLTRQLLAFSRKQKLESQAVDFNQLVAALTSLLARTLGPTINIKTSLRDGLWVAEADRAQLESAIVNLSVNARDAMPMGGDLIIETANKTLDAEYAAENAEVVPGEYVMVAVSDTGTGMSPEVLARVFEPFFTTKEVGKGTGLGLSMVYGFAKQSGGHAKIYSELGVGTTIRLYLPRSRREVNPIAQIMPKDDALRAKGEVVLVVEDDANVRAMVTHQLSELGYGLLEAGNAADAVKIIESPEKLDLLFTDIVMPGKIKCQDLIDRVREVRPDLAILLTSGFSEAAIQNGTDGRPCAILSKPYRRLELARKIRDTLDQPALQNS